MKSKRLDFLSHTFATLSLQEGVAIKAVQEILGHHSPAFTLETYTNVTQAMKNEATKKIGELLAAAEIKGRE